MIQQSDYQLVYQSLVDDIANFQLKFGGHITADSTLFDSWINAINSAKTSIDALPVATSTEQVIKNDAYVSFYDAYNFTSFFVTAEDGYVYDNVNYASGTLIYWFTGTIHSFENINSDEDTSFDISKKYLSPMIYRFFDSEMFEQYPEFIEFAKQWLMYCDENFWKILQYSDKLNDVENCPDDIIEQMFQSHNTVFGRNQQYKKIDYFLNGTVVDHDKVRHFMRISRAFNLSRGNMDSIFTLFKMLGKQLRIRYPHQQLLRCSPYV